MFSKPKLDIEFKSEPFNEKIDPRFIWNYRNKHEALTELTVIARVKDIVKLQNREGMVIRSFSGNQGDYSVTLTLKDQTIYKLLAAEENTIFLELPKMLGPAEATPTSQPSKRILP